MSTPTELSEAALEASIGTPQSVSGDAGAVTAQSIPDQIELDRYLAAKAAASKKSRGLRFTKLVPPGNA